MKTVATMTQLILNIPNEQDVDWLVPLLQRLGISVADSKTNLTSEKLAYHQAIIAKGGTDKANFDEYLTDFEKSRQDRLLPFPII